MPEGFDVTSCRDLDGCVHGRISLDAEIDGVRQSDEFGLLIRYRPGKPIMDIVVEPYDNNPDYCDITFGFYTMLEEGHYEYGFGQYGVHYYYPMPDVKLGYNRLVEKNRYMGADLFIEFYHFDEYSGSGGDFFIPKDYASVGQIEAEQCSVSITEGMLSVSAASHAVLSLKIFDLRGVPVKSESGNPAIDLSSLGKGAYILCCILDNGQVFISKFLNK